MTMVDGILRWVGIVENTIVALGDEVERLTTQRDEIEDDPRCKCGESDDEGGTDG